MRLLRRIVLTVVLTVGVLYVIAEWIGPVALSYYAARKAPSIVRVVPTGLVDVSISDAPGIKLSYLGYEFEVPWTDLDESQTKLYPTDKPAKFKVDLHFKSGLRLLVTSVPARSLVDDLPKELNTSPKILEAAFGPDTMKSDYSFNKAVYEFTPDKMNHWDFRRAPVNRDEFLLIIKSIVLSPSASSGIFNIQNERYVGFQQGNPQAQPHGIIVSLYSDHGEVEMIFTQKDYRKSVGITQPEINRAIRSLRQVPTQKPQIQARLARTLAHRWQRFAVVTRHVAQILPAREHGLRCLMLDMEKRWRVILLVWGFSLFAALTYHAVRVNHETHRSHPSRYFWWGAARLDSDPMNRHPTKMGTVRPCPENESDCVEWDPETIWVEPSLMERTLVFSAFPAFIVGLAVVRGLGHLGVSEVATFTVAMPLCIALWFYSVGWLLDRWRYKRRTRIAATSS